MKKRFNFTQQRIATLPIPEKSEKTLSSVRKEYYDIQQPKLIIRVSSTGSRSFAVLKKDKIGHTKRITIGRFPDVSVSDARDQATEILSKLSKGTDPVEEKRIHKMQSQTLHELIETYIQNHALKPRSIKDYRQKLHWGFSDWMTKPASEITEKKILARHKKLSPKGETSTNDSFVRLRAVLNYAHAIGAINYNPVIILSSARLWHKKKQRKEMIQSHQLKEWVDAVEQITPQIHRTAFLTMLFMGFRITETYSLKWQDVDLENQLITQRDTKNGTDHELPIPATLIPLITQLRQEALQLSEDTNEEPVYLFPAKQRDSFAGYPKKPIAQINNKISFHFTPHMTRHTFTTIAEAVNIPKTMIDRLTNHTTTNDVTGGYIHTETHTLREAINKIDAYIQSRINKASNVIQLYRQ